MSLAALFGGAAAKAAAERPAPPAAPDFSEQLGRQRALRDIALGVVAGTTGWRGLQIELEEMVQLDVRLGVDWWKVHDDVLGFHRVLCALDELHYESTLGFRPDLVGITRARRWRMAHEDAPLAVYDPRSHSNVDFDYPVDFVLRRNHCTLEECLKYKLEDLPLWEPVRRARVHTIGHVGPSPNGC